MELWQLGALVGFGVTLIVFLVHLSGGSRKAVLASDDAAAKRYLDDFPASRIRSVVRTKSAGDGFLILQDGTVGLVHAVGDAFLTRHLTSGAVKSATSSGPRLTVRFADFTFPSATFEFADAALAASFAKRLSL